MRGGWFSYESRFIKNLPIRTIDLSNKNDVEKQANIVEFVQRMLDLHEKLPNVKTPEDKNIIERQIAATDNQINSLVYELYELTDKEIRIVEESS